MRLLDPYLPLVLMFALAGAFALFSVASAPLIGPRRYNRAKLDAYECGIEPSPQPVVGGGRMPVAYYLTGQGVPALAFAAALLTLLAYRPGRLEGEGAA